jgi:predicted dienelactone hydrolase
VRTAAGACALALVLALQPASAQVGRRGGLAERLRSARGGDRAKGSETADIAGLRVSIWRPSPQPGAHAPLVIFSHGFHGTSTQSAFLMRALAAAGYLVIAPNHKDAGGPGGLRERPEMGFGKPDEWTDATYRDRADDITSLVRALRSDTTWENTIDWSKVAFAGHSLGGYTVLGLAGAWPAWKLPEVKAVLALSPYASPFINKRTLGGLHVPVMYQGGTRDIGISPSLGKGGGAYDLTPAPAYYVEFQGAGHLAWTDLVQDFQSSIGYYCLAFLNKYVKGDGTADPAKRLGDVAALRVR